MSINVSRHEPLGIVIQDGGQAAAAPKIMMWYWANEADVPDWERD
jgi:hypothetical protein